MILLFPSTCGSKVKKASPTWAFLKWHHSLSIVFLGFLVRVNARFFQLLLHNTNKAVIVHGKDFRKMKRKGFKPERAGCGSGKLTSLLKVCPLASGADASNPLIFFTFTSTADWSFSNLLFPFCFPTWEDPSALPFSPPPVFSAEISQSVFCRSLFSEAILICNFFFSSSKVFLIVELFHRHFHQLCILPPFFPPR